MIALRVAGFAASSAAVRSPAGLTWVYGAPLAAVAIALVVAFQGPKARGLGARAVRSVSLAVRRLAPRMPLLRGA